MKITTTFILFIWLALLFVYVSNRDSPEINDVDTQTQTQIKIPSKKISTTHMSIEEYVSSEALALEYLNEIHHSILLGMIELETEFIFEDVSEYMLTFRSRVPYLKQYVEETNDLVEALTRFGGSKEYAIEVINRASQLYIVNEKTPD